MGLKSRCTNYCNDCHQGKSSGWRIVELTSTEATKHLPKSEPLIPCKPNNTDNCCDNNPLITNRCNDPVVDEKSSLISYKNPTNTLLVIPDIETTLGTTSNFSRAVHLADFATAASLPTSPIYNTVDFTNWSNLSADILSSFDATSGTYVVPASGDYFIRLVASYESSVPLPINANTDDIPLVKIYDVDTDAVILKAALFVNNILVNVPPVCSSNMPCEAIIKGVVSKGQVFIEGIVSLINGQRLRVKASSNGLTYFQTSGLTTEPTINFSPINSDTTLSITKVRNTPTITYNFNN